MFDRIIVATDLTAQSSGALRLAARMAAPRARVVAVHVLDMPPVLSRWSSPHQLPSDLSSYRELLKHQIAGAQAALEAQLLDLGMRFDVAIRVGDPATHIATAADRHRAEAILVGRGARGRLGPTAEAVVRLSGRVVVVAPVPPSPRKQRLIPSSHRRSGGRGNVRAQGRS